MGATQKTLKSIYCGLFPGLIITSGCLTFRLTDILIGLMYVLNTATNILFRGCSQFALNRPLKRQVCQMVE